MIVSVRGLVVNSENKGESDKQLTLITHQYGKLYVYARGGRRLNSKFMSSSLKFSYGEYLIKKTDSLNILSEAELMINFFDLKNDLKTSALADYIVDVLADTTMPEEPEPETLELALNCLYVLANGRRTPETVKTVFEWRMINLLGFAPALDGCRVCGRSNSDWYYLDIMDGEITCRDCGRGGKDAPEFDDGTLHITSILSNAEVYAATRIMRCDKSKMFSLPSDPDIRRRLAETAEKYLLNHLERSYNTLDFYKEIVKLP